MKIYYPEKQSLEGVTHMCIAAHQDDIEIMAFAPISECYGSEENAFVGVVVTDGAGSPRTGEFADMTDEQMKEVRVLEQQKAADIGKYRAAIQLGFPSKAVKNPENGEPVDEIYKLLMSVKPKYLYTHNIADKHETHVAVALRTIEAVRRMPKEDRPLTFTSLEVWRALDWLPDDDKVCLLADGDAVAVGKSHSSRTADACHFEHLVRIAGGGVARRVFLERGHEIHLAEHIKGIVRARTVGTYRHADALVEVAADGRDTA